MTGDTGEVVARYYKVPRALCALRGGVGGLYYYRHPTTSQSQHKIQHSAASSPRFFFVLLGRVVRSFAFCTAWALELGI